ncbi:MAG: hypothetical protein Kow0068_04080 [Marinilabiliales bacterium]
MFRFIISTILFSLFFLTLSFPQEYGHRYSDIYYAGIPADEFENFVTPQLDNYWCWAASAQMVFNYYGIEVSQKEIVKWIYDYDENGYLPDKGVSLKTLNYLLNISGYDTLGTYFEVKSIMGKGAPIPAKLIEELSNKKPVIVGYATPEGGHVVVVTGVKYKITEIGPKILGFIVRDPMPDQTFSLHNGVIEYPGKSFAKKINAYWLISIKKF